jgi:hypothetical protein
MMRSIFAALALASLSACNFGVASPGTVAAKSTLDEKAGITAETTYVAVSKMGVALVTFGALDKARFKALDADAYGALLAVRAAYQAGNATDYARAISRLNAAVGQIGLLLNGSAQQ